MKRLVTVAVFVGAVALNAPADAAAQQGANFLAVGEMAPDIRVVGATRYGILAEPVQLSSFRGKTVVLAFFFKARTPG